MDEIAGFVEKIVFQNEETGYVVASLQVPRKKDPFTIVGLLPGIQVGETIRCKGSWKSHLTYGQQLEVSSFTTEAPTDVEGIKKYLGSGLVQGIGPAYAERIVAVFGKDTLTIIDNDPERLTEVPGIGKKRVEQIEKQWDEHKAIRNLMIQAQKYSISPTYAKKIFRAYGENGLQKLEENPFQLARDIVGIGFKIADKIAESMGIAKDATARIDAGIEYVFTELSGDGHVCYPAEEFIEKAGEILAVEKTYISARLSVLVAEGRLMKATYPSGKIFLWLKSLYLCETGITREVERLQNSHCSLREIDQEKAVAWAEKTLGISLATHQKKAIIRSLQEKAHIITGGPGTGKSTITKAILAISKKLSGNIILAAPTGRAAKRMQEITGEKAKTIHSLLAFDFAKKKFRKGKEDPLDCELIIIDEASMIDTYLMYSLLKAIPNKARVLFVGDVDQLPSVGPGNVLKDMIRSGKLPVTELTEIFRQAAGSKIITNAHRINKGQCPDLHNKADSDFFFMAAEEQNQVLDMTLDLVAVRLPKTYGLNPVSEIQVLTPMNRGLIGTANLNAALQKKLNPMHAPLVRGEKIFCEGDKVMQIRNNYTKEVYNGDIGIIKSIDFRDQELLVQMDDRDVIYTFLELDDLVLAYAVSVHKFQGSECPCVVMPVHTAHYKLLHRNLLYTAVTRGKKLVVLVGMQKALFIAVANNEVQCRYTGLFEALTGMLP